MKIMNVLAVAVGMALLQGAAAGGAFFVTGSGGCAS